MQTAPKHLAAGSSLSLSSSSRVKRLLADAPPDFTFLATCFTSLLSLSLPLSSTMTESSEDSDALPDGARGGRASRLLEGFECFERFLLLVTGFLHRSLPLSLTLSLSLKVRSTTPPPPAEAEARDGARGGQA